MKETEQPLCLVHKDATLHSHNATVLSEEEPSIFTTRDAVADEDHQDTSAMEYTKVKRKKGGKKNRGCSPLEDWRVISNVEVDLPARIIIGWYPKVYEVQCVHCSKQWITCKVLSAKHGLDITISFIYGLNTPADRQEIWDYIGMQRG
ncbi:hypothetical protein OIU79_029124 [Salix purpurea]|uniref:Uncharacterized protein n=1 Tax=Salix purpurea TaxID=77065 RepID=A0A9Q0SCB9_SALPP|nr:hypothetical protein OIU79_029124 [Salix purpurea]